MTARKRRLRVRRKPNSISTDAALVAATCFKLALDLDPIENEEAKRAFLSPFVDSVKGATVIPSIQMMELLDKAVSPACESSAEFLAQVEFGERLFNRLNFDDPKHVVAFMYCLLRLAPDSVTSDKHFDAFKAQFGKYWWWPFIWGASLQLFEIVRQRWDEEAGPTPLMPSSTSWASSSFILPSSFKLPSVKACATCMQ